LGSFFFDFFLISFRHCNQHLSVPTVAVPIFDILYFFLEAWEL
jgi:hypothetical protein